MRSRPTPAPVAAAQPLAAHSPDDPVVLDDRPGHYRQFLTRPTIIPTLSAPDPITPAAQPELAQPQPSPVPAAPQRQPTPNRRRQIEARAAAARAMRPAPVKSGRPTLIIGLAIIGLVGLALLAYALTRTDVPESPQIIGSEVDAETVQLTINSTPAGARVFAFGDTGPSLGVTPLTIERPKGDGKARFVVTLPGLANAQVELSLAADGAVLAKLAVDK